MGTHKLQAESWSKTEQMNAYISSQSKVCKYRLQPSDKPLYPKEVVFKFNVFQTHKPLPIKYILTHP